MSNERVTAISFMINGRQAEQTLERLTQRAEELREAIDAAQESGDSQNVERLNRELEGVNREIAIINRNVRSVENALEYLRGVTKEDVKNGMDYWQEQANGLQIGTEAWERAFNSYISYKADYEKILALERNPLELLLHYEMEWRDQQKQMAQADYEQGLLNYRDYKRRMLEIDRDFYDIARTNSWISNKDAQEFARQLDIINGKLAQMNQQDERRATRDQWNERIAQIKEEYRIEQETLTASYENQQITRRAFEEQKFRNEIDYLYRLKEVYRENSYDRHRIENEIQRKEQAHQQKKAEEFLLLKKQMEDSYFSNRSEITRKTNEEEYQIAHETLLKIVQERKQLLDRQLSSGEINQEQYERLYEELVKSEQRTEDFIQRKYEQNGKKLTKNYYKEWFGTITNAMGEEIDGWGKKLGEFTSVAASALSALQQSVTQLVQAELEIQLHSIEKRYEKEISYAEGNSYQVQKLEKEKQKEMAKAKAEAQRKTFALQVLSTLATTAQNAISAYGAALQIGGLAGLILAPIAAAAAVTAGMIQVAVIKKQQEAAEASYEVGGYTKKGKSDEVAGLVHAGEWVAPQSLVSNPAVAPTIKTLERVRRGELSASVLGESPATRAQSLMAITMQTAKVQNVIGNTTALTQRETLLEESREMRVERRIREIESIRDTEIEDLRVRLKDGEIERMQMTKMFGEMSQTISRLNKRLNEPFVTVNTVVGDHGIQKAQDDYALLMRNKSPKSRR